jgi:foldase protein PrsA
VRRLAGILALCMIAVAATYAGCGGGVPGGAVATVDGESIDKSAFDHWLSVATRAGGRASQVPKPPDYTACVAQKRKTQPELATRDRKGTDAKLKAQCAREYSALREQVLELLVTQRWIEGEAEDMGISVGRSEVQRSLARQRAQSFPNEGDFQKFLEQSGQTERDLLARLRAELLSDRIRDKVTRGKASVTEAQIAEHYRENRDRYAQPERRDVRVVLTKSRAAAERAKTALADGTAWTRVVARHSIDKGSRAQEGKLDGVVAGQLEKPLSREVFRASENEVSGPIRTRLGHYVFEVVAIHEAARGSLAQAKPAIRQELAVARQQRALDQFTRRFRDKWKRKTECGEDYLTSHCKNGPAATPSPGDGQR